MALDMNVGGLLSRGINDGIKQTAKSKPSEFYYFNNGVSAVCTDFTVDGNEIHATGFQIINGAQTVGALYQNDATDGVEVLFRLTKTGSVKTEKAFTRDIIEFNNTQNVIRVSDFRSNDQIQKWLEERLRDVKARGPLRQVHYIRKRRVGRQGLGQGLRLEDLAKIRYAFLYEPTLIYESPVQLWTDKENGGAYERAFGVDGVLHDAWSEPEVERCLLAITCYFHLVDAIGALVKSKKAEYKYLNRFRFHGLALVGHYVREKADVAAPMVKTQAEFDTVWHFLWPEVLDAISDVMEDALETEHMTLSALVRNVEKWKKMLKKFDRRALLTKR